MNWLAKINLNTMIERLGPFRSAIFLLLLFSTCLYSGYRVGNYYHGFHVRTLELQKGRLDDFYQQQLAQSQRIHRLEAELEFERMGNQEAQKTLKTMESDHYQVKKQLAFYEKVMAPEKQADGLVIDSVNIGPSQSLNHFRFEVILIQQTIKKRYAKGHILLTLSGSLDNKPSEIKVSDILAANQHPLSFSFRYFQVITGEFSVPDNFIAEHITVSAVLPKGKWQDYNRLDETYVWSKLMADQQVILD